MNWPPKRHGPAILISLEQLKEEHMHRQWLYHADCPQGRIFTGDEIAQAVKDGWLDSPALIGQAESGSADEQHEPADYPAAPTSNPEAEPAAPGEHPAPDEPTETGSAPPAGIATPGRKRSAKAS